MLEVFKERKIPESQREKDLASLPQVVVLAHKRRSLLETSFESLVKTEPSKIIVMDDASGEEMEEYWRKLEDRGVEVVRNEPKIGVNSNSWRACEFMANSCGEEGCFILTGSDFLYNRNWLRELYRIYNKYKKSMKIGMVGGYRSRFHQHVLQEFEDCSVLNVVCGPVLVDLKYWREISEDVMKKVREGGTLDGAMVEQCWHRGYSQIMTKKGYCQHLGIREGVNAESGDVGRNFIGEVGEFDLNFQGKLSRKVSESWVNCWPGGDSHLVLYDDGTADFGGGPAIWEKRDGTLWVHDLFWTTEVKLDGYIYKGLAYPGGTYHERRSDWAKRIWGERTDVEEIEFWRKSVDENGGTARFFDKWRKSYDWMTFQNQVEFATICGNTWPDQRHYSREVISIIEGLGDGLLVMEVGGHRGDLAQEVLSSCSQDKVLQWDNYDLQVGNWGQQTCRDKRYRLVLLFDFLWNVTINTPYNCLVATHTIEHMRGRDLKAWWARIPATVMYLILEAPIEEMSHNWNGYEGSHILELGWQGVDKILKQHGFELVTGTGEKVRYYGRGRS